MYIEINGLPLGSHGFHESIIKIPQFRSSADEEYPYLISRRLQKPLYTAKTRFGRMGGNCQRWTNYLEGLRDN